MICFPMNSIQVFWAHHFNMILSTIITTAWTPDDCCANVKSGFYLTFAMNKLLNGISLEDKWPSEIMPVKPLKYN